MNKQQPNSGRQRALEYLLEGEFGFYGLISTRRTLPGPVLGWSYQRTHGRYERTVSCRSTRGVPYADDAAVFGTLVHLYAHRPVAQRHNILEVTVDMIYQQLALLSPAVKLTNTQLVQALDRLEDAGIKVKHEVPESKDTKFSSNERLFKLIDPLVVYMNGDSTPSLLEKVKYDVPPTALKLYRTGSFDP